MCDLEVTAGTASRDNDYMESEGESWNHGAHPHGCMTGLNPEELPLQRWLSPDTQRHQPTCWILCTAEFVSSPTLPVNSGSFSGYSLKVVSSGTGAPVSSSGFCFLLWMRLAAFPCLPSASSSCSRPSAGCKDIGVSNHQGSGLHLDGSFTPLQPTGHQAVTGNGYFVFKQKHH